MSSKWRMLCVRTILVIILTPVSACALIFPKPNPLDNDPVARAALQEYEGKEHLKSPHRSPAQEQIIQQAISSDQLAIGMKMDEVQSVWGQPREIERAGDPRSGNEKWIYPGGISSIWKMQPTRYVYFEEGQVSGWESSD